MKNYESDAELWDMIFAVNHTFTGWTPQYIYWHMPLRWFRMYVSRLADLGERQMAAAKGKPYVPRSELTPEKMEEKNDRIRKARAQLDGGDFDEDL